MLIHRKPATSLQIGVSRLLWTRAIPVATCGRSSTGQLEPVLFGARRPVPHRYTKLAQSRGVQIVLLMRWQAGQFCQALQRAVLFGAAAVWVPGFCYDRPVTQAEVPGLALPQVVSGAYRASQFSFGIFDDDPEPSPLPCCAEAKHRPPPGTSSSASCSLSPRRDR